MRKTTLFLATLLLFGLAQATYTDTNYVMTQADIYGNANILTDGNYVLLAEVGEPITEAPIDDDNLSIGPGFFGEPRPFFELIVAAIEEALAPIIVLPSALFEDDPLLPTMLAFFGIAAITVLGLVYYKDRRKKEGKENAE